MKVILEIDDKYASVLSVTVVGTSPSTTYVSTHVVALENHNHMVLDENGHWTDEMAENVE